MNREFKVGKFPIYLVLKDGISINISEIPLTDNLFDTSPLPAGLEIHRTQFDCHSIYPRKQAMRKDAKMKA